MSPDFTGLTAAVVAGLPEVKACLMVSRDGLPLACHPAAEEQRVLGQWTRLAAVGDVHRGFVEIGNELWVFVQKGGVGALATAPLTGRAGAILVELETRCGKPKRREPEVGGRAVPPLASPRSRTTPAVGGSPCIPRESAPPDSLSDRRRASGDSCTHPAR